MDTIKFFVTVSIAIFNLVTHSKSFANVEVETGQANNHTGNYAFYFLTSDAAATIIPDIGFRKWNVATASTSSSATSEMITFDVRTDKTNFSVPAGGALVVTLKVSNGNVTSLVPIAGAGIAGVAPALCSSGTNTFCTNYIENSTNYFAAIFPLGSAFPIRIGILPADICSYFLSATGQAASGCSSGAVSQNSTVPISVTIQFSVVASLTTQPTLNPDPVDSRAINLYFSNLAASFSSTATYCTTTLQDFYYRPGDEALVIDGGAVRTLAGYASNSSIVPPSKLLGVAQLGANPTVSTQSDLSSSSYFVGRADFGFVGNVSGVTNSTSTSSAAYGLNLYIVDQAGAIDTNTHCDISTAMATSINGLLSQNECFIATAASGSRTAPEVVLLRHFRDTWLKGSAFTRWYYTWSPGAASWLHRNTWAKPVVRHALYPVVLFAGFALLFRQFPWIIFGLLGFGAFVLCFRRSSSNTQKGFIFICVIIQAMSISHSVGAESQTPLLDSIRNAPPTEPARSLIEEVRSQPQSPEESIIQRIQGEAGPDSSSENYTEREKSRLLEIEDKRDHSEDLPDSAIQAVQNETSQLKMRFDRNIHHAAGIHVGLVRTLNITTTNQANAFESVYTSNWAPDVTMFYEFQPFHSEIFGNFGLVGSIGFSSYRGRGVYSKSDIPKPSGGTFGSASTVPFQLVTIPATVGANYRFNLLQILRPFAEASLLLAGVAEFREDGKAAKFGLAKALLISGGVAVLIDWFSKRSAWDLQNESGIKHSYLIARYHLSIPVASNINLGVNGIYSGLAFEF